MDRPEGESPLADPKDEAKIQHRMETVPMTREQAEIEVLGKARALAIKELRLIPSNVVAEPLSAEKPTSQKLNKTRLTSLSHGAIFGTPGEPDLRGREFLLSQEDSDERAKLLEAYPEPEQIEPDQAA